MLLRVGQKAPEIEATAYHQGEFKEVKLSDYDGKWRVVCFYPGDFTFVWPTELSAVAVKYDELQELGVEVLAVSTNSHFSHKIWDEVELSKMVDGGIPFPMLADTAGKIGKDYCVYDEEAGVDVRGRFIIDPDGVLQAMEILTPPVGRNVEELIRQVKAYQLVRESDGSEATPSGWQPGKPTLKPNPDLVGKVYEVWSPDNAFSE